MNIALIAIAVDHEALMVVHHPRVHAVVSVDCRARMQKGFLVGTMKHSFGFVPLWHSP
jgi:hypothetical protein